MNAGTCRDILGQKNGATQEKKSERNKGVGYMQDDEQAIPERSVPGPARNPRWNSAGELSLQVADHSPDAGIHLHAVFH